MCLNVSNYDVQSQICRIFSRHDGNSHFIAESSKLVSGRGLEAEPVAVFGACNGRRSGQRVGAELCARLCMCIGPRGVARVSHLTSELAVREGIQGVAPLLALSTRLLCTGFGITSSRRSGTRASLFGSCAAFVRFRFLGTLLLSTRAHRLQ